MILSALIHGHLRSVEQRSEVVALIDEVMENMKCEDVESRWISPGEVATFMFADYPAAEFTRENWPDNSLQVSVNSKTGFGGLVWYATQERVARDAISKYIWVSHNPAPPDFDPRVVGDPGIPHFFDPRSTLPTERVRAALEEFCAAGSGDRPESIQWVRGDINGERNE